MRSLAKKLRLIGALGLLSGGVGQGWSAPASQLQPFPQQQPYNAGDSAVDRSLDPMSDKLRHQQVKAMNDLRQKQMVTDTNKLLQLATELKTEVDKTDKETLSINVIKKADQIEKLARSVREKMKGQ